MKKQGVINCLCLAALSAGLGVANILFPNEWFLFASIGCGTALYHYAMRLAVGQVFEMLYSRWHLNAGNFWFRQKCFEPGLYKLLRVRHWKNKLPTAFPEGYSLSRLSLEEIVHNTCHAELCHEVIGLLSFVPLLFSFVWGSFGVFLITSILAAASDLVFSVIQRYNRPRLLRLISKGK